MEISSLNISCGQITNTTTCEIAKLSVKFGKQNDRVYETTKFKIPNS